VPKQTQHSTKPLLACDFSEVGLAHQFRVREALGESSVKGVKIYSSKLTGIRRVNGRSRCLDRASIDCQRWQLAAFNMDNGIERVEYER
jgi:hypothetical protein